MFLVVFVGLVHLDVNDQYSSIEVYIHFKPVKALILII